MQGILSARALSTELHDAQVNTPHYQVARMFSALSAKVINEQYTNGVCLKYFKAPRCFLDHIGNHQGLKTSRQTILRTKNVVSIVFSRTLGEVVILLGHISLYRPVSHGSAIVPSQIQRQLLYFLTLRMFVSVLLLWQHYIKECRSERAWRRQNTIILHPFSTKRSRTQILHICVLFFTLHR